MGFSLGGSYGSSSSKSAGTSSTSNTYTPGQSALQDALMSAFSRLLPGVASGQIGPNVTAMQTQNADTINKSYSAMGDKMNRYLAARGFGQSGQVGKAALETELGRQGALAQNNSNAAGMQLNFDQALLSDSLLAAFNKVGDTSVGNSTGSSSGWGVGGGVSAGFTGIPGVTR